MSGKVQENIRFSVLNDMERTTYDDFISGFVARNTDPDYEPNAHLLYTMCEKVGMRLRDRDEFVDMSVDDQVKYIKTLNLPGFPLEWLPKTNSDNIKIQNIQKKEFISSDVVNPSTAMHVYSESNPIVRGLVADITSGREKMSTEGLKQALMVVLSYLQGIPGELLLGQINTNATVFDVDSWKLNNRGEAVVVGPLTIWKTLERVGVLWNYIPHVNDALSYLRFSRNGLHIDCYSKWEVTVPNGFDEEPYVNKFLEGVTWKGKPVSYAPISVTAFEAAAAFFTRYQADQKGKGQRVSFSLIVKKGAQLPFFSKRLSSMFQDLQKELAEHPIVTKQPDVLHEKVARIYEAWRKPSDQQLDLNEFQRSTEAVDQFWKSARKVFDDIRRQSTNDRIVALEKRCGAVRDIDKAMDIVKSSREHVRNLTPEDRMLTTQLGSVIGSSHDSWVDTMAKGHNIVAVLKQLKVEADADTAINCYGVAYGNMSPALRTLKHPDATADKIRWYDNKKAANSTEVFERTDVFYHNTPGWVIDDSNAHNVPDSMKNNPDNTGLNGDMLKIRTFMRQNAPVIVSKMNALLNWRTKDHLTWKKLLFDDFRYHTVRLMKLGKLHNPEVFLVMVKQDVAKLPKDEWNHVLSDIRSVALCTSVMNGLINQSHLSGVRYRGTQYHTDRLDGDGKPVVENGVPVVDTIYFDPRDTMMSLLACLPSKWVHYAHLVKRTDLSGGAAQLVLELDTGNAETRSGEDFDDVFSMVYNPNLEKWDSM